MILPKWYPLAFTLQPCKFLLSNNGDILNLAFLNSSHGYEKSYYHIILRMVNDWSNLSHCAE